MRVNKALEGYTVKKACSFLLATLILITCVIPKGAVNMSAADLSAIEKNAASNLEYYFPREGTATIKQGTMIAPDPWIVKKDNYYYFCYSGGDGVCVAAADSLDKAMTNGNKVYTAPAGTMYSAEYWAPELHYINGEWYIYVAADNGDNVNHRMYVLKGTSQDPTKPFVMVGKITDSTNKWAIDATILQTDNGELYYIWSGWPGDTNYVQNIYIAKMSSPTTISSARVLLSTPSYSWELVGSPDVNEGPAVISHSGRWGKITHGGVTGWINLDYTDAVSGVTDRSNYTANTQYRVTADVLNIRASHSASAALVGTLNKDTVVTTTAISKTYHIVYSASGSWTDDYCMGVLTCSDGNFLNASSWVKSSTPLVSKASSAYGPGHCSFTKSYDDKEDWIVYHATAVSGSGWDNRTVRYQKVGWNGDFPVISTPPAANTDVSMKYDGLRRVDVGTNFYARIVHKSGMYVTAVGSNLQIENSNGGNDQLWKFTRNSDGTYIITSAADSRAIDVSGGGGHYNNENNVGLWTSTGDHPQKWSLMIDDQGYFRLKSHGGRTVLDLYENNSAAGTNLQLFEEHDGDSQRFVLVYSSLNLGDEFNATVKVETADLYVQAKDGVVGIGALTNSENQYWHFKRNGDGTYCISNVADDRLIEVKDSGTANGTPILVGNRSGYKNQRWTIHSSTNGSYTIQAICSGKVLDVPNAELVDGKALQLYDRNNSDAQRVVITLADLFALKDGVKELLSGEYLTAVTKGTTAKAVSDSFKCKTEIYNGSTLVGEGDVVGTGYIVKGKNIYSGQSTAVIVIAGDCTGDGAINANDIIGLKQRLGRKITLTGAYEKACDFNNDEMVSSLDFIAMKQMFKNG